MAELELLVDGTNVAWAWPKTRVLLLKGDFAAAQRLLVESTLSSPLRGEHPRLTFVFDGPPPKTGPTSQGPGRVLYPDIGQSADDRILELLEQSQHSHRATLLVSSDRALRDSARLLGATTKGSMALIQRLDQGAGSSRGLGQGPGPRERKPSPSPSDTEKWLRDFYRREFDKG